MIWTTINDNDWWKPPWSLYMSYFVCSVLTTNSLNDWWSLPEGNIDTKVWCRAQNETELSHVLSVAINAISHLLKRYSKALPTMASNVAGLFQSRMKSLSLKLLFEYGNMCPLPTWWNQDGWVECCKEYVSRKVLLCYRCRTIFIPVMIDIFDYYRFDIEQYMDSTSPPTRTLFKIEIWHLYEAFIELELFEGNGTMPLVEPVIWLLCKRRWSQTSPL